MNKKYIALIIFTSSFALVKTEGFLDWFNKKKQAQKIVTEGVKQAKFYPFSVTHRVMLVQGDLFNVSQFIREQLETATSYTIVNAANKVLQLGGGIAGEIKKRDKSGTVQAQCDALREQYGSTQQAPYKKRTGFFGHTTYNKTVPVGSAWITSSGDLLKNSSINAIIHAVGPNCQETSDPYERDNFEPFLYKTYTSIFDSAIEYNKTNPKNKIDIIACPSISTAIFQCNLAQSADAAAEVILSSVREFSKEKTLSKEKKDAPHPKIFIMVTWSVEDFMTYRNAFDRVYKSFFSEQ